MTTLWLVERGETFLNKDLVAVTFDKEEAEKIAKKQMASGTWHENPPNYWECGCEYVSIVGTKMDDDLVQKTRNKIADFIRKFVESEPADWEFKLNKLAKQIEDGEYEKLS